MQGRKRDADVGNGLVDAVGEDRVGQIESVRPTYIHCRCTMESCWEAAVWHRELTLVLCDDLGGGMGGWAGREAQKGMYVYIGLIHDVVQQKLTLYCKSITFQ